MPKTQSNTFVSLSTPLGPEVLLLERLSGVEGVSRLFHFEMELLSEDPEIDFSKIVGQPVTVSLDLHGLQAPRHLHGHISRFQQLRNRSGLACYRAELVPWLWFLTQTTDCRIFQNKRVHDIIEQICKDHGHRDIRNDLEGAYAKMEYCVQYRETDFAFVSRLMEHFGISYYFEHKKDKHVLVLVDSLSKFAECPGQKAARYKEDERVVDLLADPGVVTDLRMRQDVRPAKFTYRDYNFERPQQTLEAVSKGTIKVKYPAYEVYDHPGKFLVRDEGEALARLRMQALETTYLLINGTSTCRPFMPGYTFELTGHPRGDANNKHLLLEVNHDISAGGYTDEKPHYENHFSCIPVQDPGMIPLRPARITPWPRVEGPQTAVVVGESGEEIFTDKHGRIKVQFHWDREGKRNEESSCWVRVSQGWAGKGFGAMFLPRVGQEVIVDFLEGDPDQPIVTGAVYNAQQTPPYELPKDKTKSTIKTNSYKGSGFNEFRFEDKAGEEEIFLHAQKDFNETIKNNHTTNVGADQTITVKKNLSIHVDGHQSISISGKGTGQKDPKGQDVKGSTLNVVGNGVIDASDSISITAPNKITLTCGGSSISMVPGSITLTAGDGASVTLTADAVIKGGLTHMDGSSTGKVTAPTIEATGTNIKISGSADVKASGSGSSLTLDANADLAGTKASVAGKAATVVSGGASVDITAALIKIN